MTAAKQNKSPSYAGAPAKAPGKPQAWQFPKTGHSAGYKGAYASNGKFAADVKRGQL